MVGHTKEMSQSILIYRNNFRSVSVTLLFPNGVCGSLNESLDLQALHRQIKQRNKIKRESTGEHAMLGCGVKDSKVKKFIYFRNINKAGPNARD